MSKIVRRTLDLLELFAEQRRPLSLSDISRLLHIPVSSCHDVLHAMQERGYLYELAPRAGYYPTLRLHHLAQTIADHDPVALRAEILLRSLRDALDESVLLSKVNGLQATYLLEFAPSHPLRFQARVGDGVRALYATSGGKALLGSLAPAALDNFLKNTVLAPLTDRTITSKSDLRREIREGNVREWHLNRGESQEGVTTVSARFAWKASVYIVTIAGPTARMEPRLDESIRMLINVCRMLEMRPDAPPAP